MKKRTAVCLSVIGLVWLLGALTWGQMRVPRLTHDLVRRIIPVMKAEIGQNQAAWNQLRPQLEQAMKRGEEQEQLIKGLEAGKIDPLVYLKQQSKHITAPASAAYKPKLSRRASLNAYGNPIAVFSYGIESSDALGNLLGGGEAAAKQLVTFGDIYKGANGKKIKAAEDEFMSFYKAKGFSNAKRAGFNGWHCASPDGGTVAFFWFYNRYAGLENVESVPGGPILELSRETGSSSADEQPLQMESRAPMSKGTALRQAGMSEEEYGEYVGALMMARNDAADPSGIDPSTLELGVEGASADPEKAKTLKEMKAFYDLRRQNVLIYEKHAAVLDPLFSAMGK